MRYNFFAYLSRMKHIERWSLMHATDKENLLEHTAMTVMLSHALSEIGINILKKPINIQKVMEISLYHDCSEVLTGDLPTPVKYFNQDINKAYKNLEEVAKDKLLGMLPEELKPTFTKALKPDENCLYEQKIVKAADDLAAYIKCLEELKTGNREFKKALNSIEKKLKAHELDEIKYFMENFMDGFSLTLDELE